MLSDFVQRHREHRTEYRPAGEPIKTCDYEIAPVDFKTAKSFVETHHYSGDYVADVRRFGLFERGGHLCGVAVFSNPYELAVTNFFPGKGTDSIELGRLVLLDHVPANAESYLVGHCMRSLRREGFIGLLSMSDPEKRTSADGQDVFGGHIGTIYQATNAVFAGRATKRSVKLLPDGTIFNERTLSKIRSGEKGWQYGSRQLERFGADPAPEDRTKRLAWLAYWMHPERKIIRRMRHGGNFRYLWALDRRARRHMERQVVSRLGSLPAYPKMKGTPQLGFSFTGGGH